MSILKKSAIAATLAATALATSSPAMARDYHRNNDNTAAVAIGAGVIGLAIGAIVASSGKDRDRYDNRYHVRDGWYYNNGYYYNRSGDRYKRADWERRYRNDRSYGNYRYNDRYDQRRGNYGDYYYRRGY